MDEERRTEGKDGESGEYEEKGESKDGRGDKRSPASCASNVSGCAPRP